MAKLPKLSSPARHLRPADLRSLAQLATQATLGVTQIVEGVHQSVWRTLGMPGGEQPGRTRGITGMVYRGIDGITQLAGKGVDAALGRLMPQAGQGAADDETPERAAVLAALNGVMGDRLAQDGNALATPMTLRFRGEVVDAGHVPAPAAVTGRLLVLIHGQCMNDLQWRGAGGGGHGEALEAAGWTPVYLRYNSGLPIWQNGQLLAAQLALLDQHWPVPVEEMAVVGHSMGGLVARSAVQSVDAQGLAPGWRDKLRRMVFLGTPHQGAPLEKAGSWIELLLGGTPWTEPFTRLTGLRSVGITDLRQGSITPGLPRPLPLPSGIACFAVAASTSAQRHAALDRLVGDGLVPLASALGQHGDPEQALAFAADAQTIVWKTNHMQLLHSPAVAAELLRWLAPASR